MKIPVHRRKAAKAIADLLESGMRVALTTHVNADGDGAGSEAAMVHLLNDMGIRSAIANPTPFPRRYRFLLEGISHHDKSSDAVKYLNNADLIIVLDIADSHRIGHLGATLDATTVPVACIDHHKTNGTLPGGPRLIDSNACATGELVFDLVRTVGWDLGPEAARALYVAILTDTGGFRFSNTSARTLQVGAELLASGVDPEEMYEYVYASAPEPRVRLLGEVLNTLVVERARGLAWVTVPLGVLERLGADAEDLEGVVEFPRSIEGVRLALLFRQISNGRIKVSFRSLGDVDVAAVAEEFGGGGHTKAAGASLEGSLGEVQERVLERVRRLLVEQSLPDS